MAQPEQNETTDRGALVRGSDGILYIILKDQKPIKLGDEQSRFIQDLLSKAEEKLSDYLIPFVGSGSNHSIPELFDE
jgi:hypothetical protein